MRSVIFNFIVFIFTSVIVSLNSYALPVHPYAPWKLSCLARTNMTLTHPDGTPREITATDVWSAELQNDRSLGVSSARVWCKSDIQHEWDTEELGPGQGWWTLIGLLDHSGELHTCPPGQAIMIEMDHNTCSGSEIASGFFYCESQNSPVVPADNSWIPWVVGSTASTATLAILTTCGILLYKYAIKPKCLNKEAGQALTLSRNPLRQTAS